jgi:hypothetical protein
MFSFRLFKRPWKVFVRRLVFVDKYILSLYYYYIKTDYMYDIVCSDWWKVDTLLYGMLGEEVYVCKCRQHLLTCNMWPVRLGRHLHMITYSRIILHGY